MLDTKLNMLLVAERLELAGIIIGYTLGGLLLFAFIGIHLRINKIKNAGSTDEQVELIDNQHEEWWHN